MVIMILTAAQRAIIEQSIRDKYRKVAANPHGLFNYPTGQAGLDGLSYDPRLYAHLPDSVREYFCGVGNPFAAGPILDGESVLDVGCGAGVDACIAAELAGPRGLAVGVDGSAEMIGRARENAGLAGLDNTCFMEGSAEFLPMEDERFDVVISSGAYNLVIDKSNALAEAWRVLRPGGRLQVADQMLTGAPPATAMDMVASWFT